MDEKINIKGEDFGNRGRKRILVTLDKERSEYFKKHLDKNNLNFSKMIDELLIKIVPDLRKGKEKFELNLDLQIKK